MPFVGEQWLGEFSIIGDVSVNTATIMSDETNLSSSANRFTGSTDTPTTDPGWTTSSSSDMNAPDGYLKVYVGTQPVCIPYFNT